MKRIARLIALVLAIGCLFSLFGVMAYAELQSGLERFEGISRSEKNQQRIEEIYEDLIYRDYSFVEIMMNDRESEGTLGWIPTTYIVNKWDPAVSQARTRQYGG